METCVNCIAFEGLQTIVEQAYLGSYPIIGVGMAKLIVSIAAVRILYLIGLMVSDSSKVDLSMMMLDLVSLGVVVTVLNSPASMFWPIYQFFVSVGPWIGVQMIDLVGISRGGYEGFSALIYVADQSILNSVFNVLKGQGEDISITSKIAHVAGIIVLAVIYLMLSWKLIKSFLVGFFEASAIAFMAPFIIAFVYFSQTRPLSFGAMRILMSSAAKMILGAVTIVVIFSLMAKVNDLFYTALPNTGVNAIWSTDFMTVLFTGFMMLTATAVFEDVSNRLFMTFGKSMASNFQSLNSFTRFMAGR